MESVPRLYPYENIFGSDWKAIDQLANTTMSIGWSSQFFQERADGNAWLMQDQSDRSRNYHAHAWDMIDPLLAAYSVTSDAQWLGPASQIALEWIALFAGPAEYSTRPGDRHMAWYDMAVGLRAYRLAFLIDAIRVEEHLDAEAEAVLWDALSLHADYLANDDNFQAHNNHGFYQAAGQLAMGRRFAAKDPKMEAARIQGEARFAAMLHQQFASDGTHREHSPDYHRMVYRTAKSLVDAGLTSDPRTIEFLTVIEQALSWFILPSGHIANIGDSDSHQFNLPLMTARRQWSTPEMRYVMTRGRIGQAPAEPFALFSEGGYVAARIPVSKAPDFTNDSYLVQQAGFHSRTHKHADTLSFLWSDRGHRILVDAGRYGYLGKTEAGSPEHKSGFWYSDPYRMYCESTRAHNCLEFDDTDYPRKDITPFGSGVGRAQFEPAQRLVAFESEAPQSETITQTRLLFLCAGHWLVCLDWFEDRKRHRHDVAQRFHFAPGIDVNSIAPEGFVAKLPRHSTPLQVRSLVAGPCRQEKVRGQKEPRLLGWMSRGYRKIDPIDTIAFAMTNAASGTFATLFHFANSVDVHKKHCRIDRQARSGELEWEADGASHRIHFSRPKNGRLLVDYRSG